jgi:hypothetical protein
MIANCWWLTAKNIFLPDATLARKRLAVVVSGQRLFLLL